MSAKPPSATEFQSELGRARGLLTRRRTDEAASAAEALVADHPERIEAPLLLARVRQQQGRFDDMLDLTETALERDPRHNGAQLQFAEACLFCGQHDRAATALSRLEEHASSDLSLLGHVAQLYAQLGKHTSAHRCYTRALELAPDSPKARYNYASSCIAMGEIERAEDELTRVIAADPKDYDAWHNRSTLRKQTPDDNHVEALTKVLTSLPHDAPGRVPICYALAREFEDLGDDEKSFDALSEGASLRRRRLAYKVESDLALMQELEHAFDADYASTADEGEDKPGPIFVLGLPRSGTTLVDRILSSHSRVESLGEINDFALSLTRLGQAADKQSLLAASRSMNPGELGAEYQRSVSTYGLTSDFFIDKTPANYLYIGLIAKAMPGAKIIHVRRHPVDSCFGMYRTLFRMGYPFSYDLEDLARYYLAYDRLMKHWHRTFPESVFDFSYEQLVADPAEQSRRLVSACGLEWEEACAQFERNRAPVATASAAQVRKPIYKDAVARWRRFEHRLTPLIERLKDGGIEI